MTRAKINGHTYPVRLFVFDKDGLMFHSGIFWMELARARTQAFRELYPELSKADLKKWLTIMGMNWLDTEEIQITGADPNGILAVASVSEEMSATAAFLVWLRGYPWTVAREMVHRVFACSDTNFQLEKALEPRTGFPDILRRLRVAGIPYGVATSDTRERVIRSLDLFDTSLALSFVVTPSDVKRGKPYPDMLEKISKDLRIPMAEILMIGDSYVDVAMAKEAGAVGVGVPENKEMRREMEPFADEMIQSLDEIILTGEEG